MTDNPQHPKPKILLSNSGTDYEFRPPHTSPPAHGPPRLTHALARLMSLSALTSFALPNIPLCVSLRSFVAEKPFLLQPPSLQAFPLVSGLRTPICFSHFSLLVIAQNPSFLTPLQEVFLPHFASTIRTCYTNPPYFCQPIPPCSTNFHLFSHPFPTPKTAPTQAI